MARSFVRRASTLPTFWRLDSARGELRPASCLSLRYGTLTGTSRSTSASGWWRWASAGGNGSSCSAHDSAIFRASPWAISVASATLRPSATRPGTSMLVARNVPPASFLDVEPNRCFGHRRIRGLCLRSVEGTSWHSTAKCPPRKPARVGQPVLQMARVHDGREGGRLQEGVTLKGLLDGRSVARHPLTTGRPPGGFTATDHGG